MGFASYELLRRLAVGGMAEIHLARQRAAAGFERLVVVKRILPELARDRDFIESFLDEARHGAQLGHPNIVQIIELGEVDNTFFIVLEYVQGVDVASLLSVQRALGRPLPVSVALHIACDILAGLDFAHNARDTNGKALGLVHRDVSPSNVIVSNSGTAKVADFGIAKATARLEGRTRTGVVKGKLGYLAPEQLQRVTIDRRVDVFAAALLIVEMSTNRHPLRADSDVETMQNLARGVTDQDGFAPELDRRIRSVLLRALSVDRDKRQASCAEFQRGLEDAAAATGVRLSALEVRAYLETMAPQIEAQLALRAQDAGDSTEPDDKETKQLIGRLAKAVAPPLPERRDPEPARLLPEAARPGEGAEKPRAPAVTRRVLAVAAAGLLVGLVVSAAAWLFVGPRMPPCPDSYAMFSEAQRLTAQKCHCDGTKSDRAVWGSDIYTADSSVCRAALHAGVVGAAGGVVEVLPAPGCPRYARATRNGVGSGGWGPFLQSFVFVDHPATCPPMAADECPERLNAIGPVNDSTTLSCTCSSGGGGGNVWGSGVYTLDSSLCRAAVHAGAVLPSGGRVTVKAAPGCDGYRGTRQNGVDSSPWARFERSFFFVGFGDGRCP